MEMRRERFIRHSLTESIKMDVKITQSGSVGVDGEGLHLDTADTVAVNDSELDVSLVSPGGVPGVLDEPVVLAGLGAPSDGKDGVIEGVSA